MAACTWWPSIQNFMTYLYLICIRVNVKLLTSWVNGSVDAKYRSLVIGIADWQRIHSLKIHRPLMWTARRHDAQRRRWFVVQTRIKCTLPSASTETTMHVMAIFCRSDFVKFYSWYRPCLLECGYHTIKCCQKQCKTSASNSCWSFLT